LLTLLLTAVPGAAAESGGSSATLEDVLAMLRADLSEEVIVEWMEAGESRLALPSASELIELREAGASERLLKTLIARSTEPAQGPSGGTEVRKPRAPAPAPVPVPSYPPPAATETEDSRVTFRLDYRPNFESDEQVWDLFVYLDGLPLANVPRGAALTQGWGLEIEKTLAPGRHTLLVTQEQHDLGKDGKWSHRTRAAPADLAFDLREGADAEVELTFRRGWINYDKKGPISFRYRQGEAATVVENSGGDPERWPDLCEELETAFGQDGPRGRAERKRLERCVRWRELWPGIEAPPRRTIREELETVEFRPQAES
jgi:hypothetical protein